MKRLHVHVSVDDLVTAYWAIPDPAAVEGSPMERERAFVTAFHHIKQRISLFAALPTAGLERSGLTVGVREIGRTSGATTATTTAPRFYFCG
jgi:arsenate reductase